MVFLGVLQNIKDLYYSVEDKYYSLLDKICQAIPIYSVIDPIDKFVPSFLLILIIIVAAFLAIVLPVIGQPGEVKLDLELADADNNPISNAEILVSFPGKTLTLKSNALGKVEASVPANSEISISVKAEGFDDAAKTITTGTASLNEKITLLKKETLLEKTITFVDASGKRILGKKIIARLSCSNNAVKPQPETVSDNDLDGEIKITPPPNCGTLGVTVTGPAGFKQNYYPIISNLQIIRLDSADIPYGILRVRLEDNAGNLLAEIDASVALYKDGSFEKKVGASYGEARISEIEEGNYFVLVEDNAGDYANATEENVRITPKQTISITVILEKSVKGKINVRVLDYETGQAIQNAAVELRSISTDKIFGSGNTGADAEQASFAVTEKGEIKIVAMADGYLPAELANVELGKDYDLKLEKITPYNSGRVFVRIYDEDLLPVQNAKVKLRFADTKTIAPYEPKISDANGVAKFAGVKKGEYFAYAEKYPASGESLPGQTETAKISYFDINMFIGTATITINAVDEDNKAIAEAEAEIKTENGEKIGAIPLTKGIGTYSLKADKKIFVIVKHPDYLPFQSESYQLYKDTQLAITAVLPKQIITAGPKVSLVGIYSEAGASVERLQAGNDYIARLQLKIPQDSAYSEAGIHFRVGAAKTIANDNLVIKEINAGAVSFINGTTFNAPNGYYIDSSEENLTESDAKWVNLWWYDPEPAVYNVSIRFRVKTETTINSLLPFYYRAWANENGTYYRDPLDNEIGEAFETTEKQALYANAFEVKDYFEGTDKQCDKAFCYTGIRIFDIAEGLYGFEPFTISAGGDYNFLFSITSNSNADYTGAKFYLTNVSGEETAELLDISAYEIVNADAQKFSYSGTPVHEISAIDSGAMKKNKSFSGNILFRPRKEEASAFRLRLVFEGNEVTKKDFAFDVVSKKQMNLQAKPGVIPAFMETDLNVSATDAETGFELKDALVRLSIEAADHSKTITEKTTNGLGIVEFKIPAMLPRALLTIEAFKKGYVAQPIEKRIDSNVLSFVPAEARVDLKSPGKTEEIARQNVSNKIASDLAIKNLRLIGSYRGILDEQKMVNYLQQWINHKFAALSTEENAKLFKIALSPGISLAKNTLVKGNFLIETKPAGFDASFPQNIPFIANISLGGLPDNSPCITIDEFKWEGTTQDNQIVHAFQILNNCMLGSKAIALSSLQAKLEWKSNAIGTIELTVTDADDPGNSNTEVLQEAVWSNLLSGIREEGTYFAVLTFTPKTGHIGETAEFNVVIDSQFQTTNGMQFVGANKKIEAELLVSNLEQCLKFSPDTDKGIKILAGAQEASFTVDSSKCGKLDIGFILCKNDNGCKGGSTEGGIIVSPQEFSLSPNAPEKTITVKRQSIAGIYGIGVSARTKNHAYREIAIMNALVEPEETESFTLDKYEFAIKGKSTKDSATLTNKTLSQEITVDASACDWGEASKKEKASMNIVFLSAGIGALTGMLQAMNEKGGTAEAAQQTTNQVIQTSASTYDAALQNLNNASIAAENLSYNAGQLENKIGYINDNSKNLDKMINTMQGQIKNIQVPTGCAACDAPMAAATAQLSSASAALASETSSIAQKALDMKNSAKYASTYSNDAFANINSCTSRMNTPIKPISSSNMEAPLLAARTSAENALPFAQAAADKTSMALNNINQVGNLTSSISSACTSLVAKKTALVSAQKSFKTIYADCDKAVKALEETCSADPSGSSCAALSTCQQVSGKYSTLNDQLDSYMNDIDSDIDSFKNDVGNLGKTVTEAKGLANTALSATQTANSSLADSINSMSGGAAALKGTSAASSKRGVFAKIALNTAIGALTGLMASGLLSSMQQDPCDTRASHPLSDYVINLKNDGKGIEMDNNLILANFDFSEAKVFGDWEKQTIALRFENNGIENDRPTYSVATITATRHFHSKTTRISRGQGFGSFNVPDASTVEYEQKFHLKFKTKDFLQNLTAEELETPSCTMGALIGKTTKSALPRIKLNWSWDEAKGIGIDSCLANNSNYVYCDATQFSIMLSKRLHALDGWLELNGEKLLCPQNQLQGILDGITEGMNSHIVPNGYAGLSNISASASGTSVTVDAKISNNNSAIQRATVEITLTAPNGVSLNETQSKCTKDANNIIAKGTKTVNCIFSGLEENTGFYTAQARLVPNASAPLDNNSTLATSFRITTGSSAGNCWIEKSTQFYDGKSALEWYAEATPNAQWTTEIPDIGSLRDIIQSDAYLVYDAYTEDFRKDFVDYYTRINFYNTPSYFNQHPLGKNISKYFQSGALKFGVKFTDSSRLPSAGLYKVDLNIAFANDNWALFNSNGSTAANIAVMFYHLNEPVPNSAMYYLPFDGEVGKQATSLNRQGYGVQYELPVAGEKFKINDAEQLFALPDAGSNALVNLKIERRDSLKALNGLASKRGFLVSIEQGNGLEEKTLVWAPSNATPVLARVKHGVDPENFSVFYSARNNNVPEITGNTLTYWSGAGSCYDFSGQLATEAFDFKPDRKARQNDNLQGWQSAYAIDWFGSNADGSVFLKTIMFTPIGSNYSLFAEKEGILFQSVEDNSESNTVSLQGISSMQFNRQGASETDRVNSLEDAFGLVESSDACVTNSGVKTSVWWNPAEIYSQEVSGKSIQSMENALNKNKQCITSMAK